VAPIRQYWALIHGERVKIKVYACQSVPIEPSVYVKNIPSIDLTVHASVKKPPRPQRKPNSDVASNKEAFDE